MQRNDARRLLQLFSDNQRKPRALEVRQEEGADEATIYLYDVIDPYWGVGAQAFVEALNGIKAATIHLRVNSPGGDVFEARAMAEAVRAHSSKVIAHIDGLAASAATYIAIAADEVEAAEGSFFMIHQAWALAIGNAEDMRAMAALLEKVDASIVVDYAKKTGKTSEELAELMKAETWFTAEEAKAAGFVDRIAGASEEEGAEAQWNLAAYTRVPKALLERKPKPKQEAPKYDRAALERRLAMYGKP